MASDEKLTRSAGIPVADNRNSLIAGPRGTLCIAPRAIPERQVAHFAKCDPAKGAGVAQRSGLAPVAVVSHIGT